MIVISSFTARHCTQNASFEFSFMLCYCEILVIFCYSACNKQYTQPKQKNSIVYLPPIVSRYWRCEQLPPKAEVDVNKPSRRNSSGSACRATSVIKITQQAMLRFCVNFSRRRPSSAQFTRMLHCTHGLD